MEPQSIYKVAVVPAFNSGAGGSVGANTIQRCLPQNPTCEHKIGKKYQTKYIG